MTTTALQRIKEIEEEEKVGDNSHLFIIEMDDAKFLFKAFNIMREIAIEEYESEEGYKDSKQSIDCKFEERMLNIKVTKRGDMKDDKEPAFPGVVDIERFEESLGKYVPHLVPMGGLTKREWFASISNVRTFIKSCHCS